MRQYGTYDLGLEVGDDTEQVGSLSDGRVWDGRITSPFGDVGGRSCKGTDEVDGEGRETSEEHGDVACLRHEVELKR